MRGFSALAALMLLPAASAAGAQSMLIPDVIGATVANMTAASGALKACLQGKTPARPEAVAEARAGAEAAMLAYVAAAAGSSPADAGAVFTAKAKLRSWRRGDKEGIVTALEDPLARAIDGGGAELIGPTDFIRSGDGAGALASWRVAAPGEAPLGYYRAALRRESKRWKLTRLELVEPPAEPDPIAYYCSTPGDSEAYAKAVAERDAKRERKRAERLSGQGTPR